MPTYKPITLKMSTAPAYGYTSIKQMDVEGVELILTLKNTDDSDYNLTSGSTLFFKMANESGNVKVTLSEMDSPSNITRDGANVVRVLLTESMVSETGIMACELQEMHSGTFTSSQLFYLRVWPTTEDGEIIDSHEYKSLVSAYLAIDNALNVATLAKNYSESTITEENARQAAELLRKQAENDRVLAESARVAAENLRGVEVANARGDHATLGDRLDEMDVGIEGNASDLENTKLKVVRLEQEVKRYKELYEQSNPTQSPRVTSTGYGVVSLPKNAGQGPMKVKVEGQTQYVQGGGVRNTSGTFRVRSVNEDETISSEQYLNGPELRSLPNGVADSIDDGKLIKRVSDEFTTNSNNIVSYSLLTNVDLVEFDISMFPNIVAQTPNINKSIFIYTWGEAIAGADRDNITSIGKWYSNATRLTFIVAKGTYSGLPNARANFPPQTLTYQLAEPIEIPIQTSGSLVSYPSGTVYIEPFVADAGIYTDKMSVLHQDLPIKALEKISKVDFETGVETELDPAQAIIAADKLSFTHPDLEAGDIVFFVYEYDRESTVGETEIEYYDSRYTIKDSVTDKFYKWNVTVADGVPSIELVEV